MLHERTKIRNVWSMDFCHTGNDAKSWRFKYHFCNVTVSFLCSTRYWTIAIFWFFMQSTKLNWKTRQHFLTVTIYFYHKSFKMLTDIYQPQSLWRQIWVRCTFILLVYHLLSIFHWGENRSIYALTLVSHVWRPELTIMTYLHQVGFAFFENRIDAFDASIWMCCD